MKSTYLSYYFFFFVKFSSESKFCVFSHFYAFFTWIYKPFFINFSAFARWAQELSNQCQVVQRILVPTCTSNFASQIAPFMVTISLIIGPFGPTKILPFRSKYFFFSITNLTLRGFCNFSATNLCVIPISTPMRRQWCRESRALRVAFFTTISRPHSEILERLFQIPQKSPNITSEVKRAMATLRRTFTPPSSCWWASFFHLVQVHRKRV